MVWALLDISLEFGTSFPQPKKRKGKKKPPIEMGWKVYTVGSHEE